MFQVVILIVLFILRKRIGLVVALFHEAGKAVHAMPYLVLIPLLVSQTESQESIKEWNPFPDVRGLGGNYGHLAVREPVHRERGGAGGGPRDHLRQVRAGQPDVLDALVSHHGLPLDHPVLHRVSAPGHCWQCRRMVLFKVGSTTQNQLKTSLKRLLLM